MNLFQSCLLYNYLKEEKIERENEQGLIAGEDNQDTTLFKGKEKGS